MSYDYTCKPFLHQVEGIQLYRGRPYYGFFDEPGCGKSKIVVDGSNLLFLDKALFAAVVVCPNTVKAVWADPVRGQIAKHTPPGFPYTVHRIQSGQRLPNYATWIKNKGKVFAWVIVNYEALRNAEVEDYLQDILLNFSPAAMILDESTRVKSPQAVQTKAVMRLARYAAKRYILTGTPIAKNPLDLYMQFNFLSPSILRYPHYVAFRNRYAVMGGHRVSGRPVQVVGWQNLNELKATIAPHSRVVLKSEALPELPPKVYIRMEVPLSTEQERAYIMMKEHAVVDIPGEIGIGTARIALTKVLRLSQITSGHVPIVNSITGNQQIISFKNNPKFDVIEEILEDTPFIVVFAMFIVEIQDLAARLHKAGISYGLIYGDVSLKEREKVQADFHAGLIRVVVCQVVTGGIGIQLTHGDTAVFTTNPYSHEARVQAEERLHRPGQIHQSVRYIDIVTVTRTGRHTIDQTVLDALDRKQNLSDAVIGRTMAEVL